MFYERQQTLMTSKLCNSSFYECDTIIVDKGLTLSFLCVCVCAESMRNETRPSAVMQSKLGKAQPKAIDHTQRAKYT